MARRPAKKSRIVTVDFEGIEAGGGSFHIKEGSYLMQVVEVEQTESDKGNDMFKWTFEGQKGAAKGKKFYVYTTLNEEALWKLRQLLEALQVEVPDGPLDIDLDEMVGLELIGIVTDEDYQGKTVSRMNDFESTDGAGEEPEEKPSRAGKKSAAKKKKDEPEKITEAEVKAMDADELADVIEKYSLEVDLDDHKTLRRKISAVVTALEEGEFIEADE
mgnify:CR=1 FL=1